MRSPQCLKCEHFWGGHLCEAFPDGIPDDIFSGEIPHAVAIEGDHGLRFTLNPIYRELDEGYASDHH